MRGERKAVPFWDISVAEKWHAGSSPYEGDLLNVGQAASLPPRSVELESLLKSRRLKASESWQLRGAHTQNAEAGAVAERDAIPIRRQSTPTLRRRGRLSSCARDVHSDSPFYGKSQGPLPGRAIFLWCFPFFCAAEKPEKSGVCAEIVQKFRTGHLGK